MPTTYFIQGDSGKCPKCGHQRYSGPTQLRAGDKLFCLFLTAEGIRCQGVHTVSDALWASTKAAGIKKLGPDILLE